MGPDTPRLALEEQYERLQHRGQDLPPLPVGLVRGAPGSILDPVAVHPVAVAPSVAPTPVQQVARLQEELGERAKLERPDFYRHGPTDDPVLARLRAWRPERG